jgi:hypothetical protein
MPWWPECSSAASSRHSRRPRPVLAADPACVLCALGWAGLAAGMCVAILAVSSELFSCKHQAPAGAGLCWLLTLRACFACWAGCRMCVAILAFSSGLFTCKQRAPAGAGLGWLLTLRALRAGLAAGRAWPSWLSPCWQWEASSYIGCSAPWWVLHSVLFSPYPAILLVGSKCVTWRGWC